MPSGSEAELRKALLENGNALRTRTYDVICPIYAGRGSAFAGLIGTGFFLRMNNDLILLTASHVFHFRHEMELYIGVNRKLIPLRGSFGWSGPEHANDPPDYKADCAFVILDEDTRSWCVGQKAIEPWELAVTDWPAEATFYCCVGFPGAENRGVNARSPHSIGVVTGPLGDPFYALVGRDPRTHFLIEVDPSAMRTVADTTTTISEPFGMSGGPIFRLGHISDIINNVAKPKVTAIAIEWWRQHRALVGVKIWIVLEAIRAARPDLDSYLPRTLHWTRQNGLQELPGTWSPWSDQ